MIVGEKLRQARKARNLSQRDLGAKAGISGTIIGQYENGLRNPRGDNLQRLAEVLGVDVEWLLTQDGADEQDDYKVRYDSIIRLADLLADPKKGRSVLKVYSQLCLNLTELQRAINDNQLDEDSEGVETVDSEFENLRRIEAFAKNCCNSFLELQEICPEGKLEVKECFNQWDKERQAFDSLLNQYLKMNRNGRTVCSQVIFNLAQKPEYQKGNEGKYDPQTIGKRIKEEREKKGISREEISAKSKVPMLRIQEIEKGSLATAKEISRICWSLGTPVPNVLPTEPEEAKNMERLFNALQKTGTEQKLPDDFIDSILDVLASDIQKVLIRLRDLDTLNKAEQYQMIEKERNK